MTTHHDAAINIDEAVVEMVGALCQLLKSTGDHELAAALQCSAAIAVSDDADNKCCSPYVEEYVSSQLDDMASLAETGNSTLAEELRMIAQRYQAICRARRPE